LFIVDYWWDWRNKFRIWKSWIQSNK